MNWRQAAWLLLVSGAVIYFVETSKGTFLFDAEASLPGSAKLGVGLGEYLIAASIGVFIFG